MPNIATVLKAEITRLARKEMRETGDGLKKTVAAQRSEITNLKRRVQALEAMVKKLAKRSGAEQIRSRSAAPSDANESDSRGLRFRASGMAANRKRLG